MNRKKAILFGLTILIGVTCFLFWHKSNVESDYRGFRITTISVEKNKFVPISKKLVMQVTGQYLNKNEYHANVIIQAKTDSSLSIANWYLYEGPTVTPNQFGTPIINGASTHVLSKGTNIIKANTNYQVEQTKHNLVVVSNYTHGKYRLFYFTNR
ncbi:hypothetical protein CXZ13_16680 (plasmid) [Lactiplantibacillus plantarum]|uniref:hypothetical protein n=1 Tax=Lactiplantibacillus plantarum TaxID=1590 RepID=UPI000CA22C6A|nr:hypothetical protein [Lactiplantibacillus plantarum]AUH38846.1 hypothetical protein CXZ13_16680 [Lactiplantibacillus plantarum]MCG0826473.1 hypothetical protein [Lactiplantibacillus plantarum]